MSKVVAIPTTLQIFSVAEVESKLKRAQKWDRLCKVGFVGMLAGLLMPAFSVDIAVGFGTCATAFTLAVMCAAIETITAGRFYAVTESDTLNRLCILRKAEPVAHAVLTMIEAQGRSVTWGEADSLFNQYPGVVEAYVEACTKAFNRD